VPWLLALQLLDCVGASVFGAITPLVIADLMSETGRRRRRQLPV